MNPRRAALVGLVFPLIAVAYFVAPTVLGGTVDWAGFTVLIALGSPWPSWRSSWSRASRRADPAAMIEELWSSLIRFTEQFVVPDWGWLVLLIPIELAAPVVSAAT